MKSNESDLLNPLSKTLLCSEYLGVNIGTMFVIILYVILTEAGVDSLQVITPFRTLVLSTDTRKDMEEWISAFKSVANREFYEVWTLKCYCLENLYM